MMKEGRLAADVKQLVDALKKFAEASELIGFSSRERAMLAYVNKLTRFPQDIVASDVESLRSAGFDDLAIHDICAITSYFAFVNRIADGLGVEVESQ